METAVFKMSLQTLIINKSSVFHFQFLVSEQEID